MFYLTVSSLEAAVRELAVAGPAGTGRSAWPSVRMTMRSSLSAGPWAREMLAVLLGAEPSLRMLGALRAGLRA